MWSSGGIFWLWNFQLLFWFHHIMTLKWFILKCESTKVVISALHAKEVTYFKSVYSVSLEKYHTYYSFLAVFSTLLLLAIQTNHKSLSKLPCFTFFHLASLQHTLTCTLHNLFAELGLSLAGFDPIYITGYSPWQWPLASVVHLIFSLVLHVWLD
jgi:hypothetical protein